jgi:hypothetical protein
MFSYDAALLDAVRSAPRSIDDVLRILRAIDSICAGEDGLKWFNWLYLQVTEAVETRVAAGEFTDAAWLAQLDIQFASLYFSALQASLSGQVAPGCWRVLFQCRNQNAIERIQFALAGINAHINHDLPEAIVATCQATGTTPDHGGPLYRDFIALNSTLDSLIDLAKSTLGVQLPAGDLAPVSHLEDTMAAWSVSAARESAWQNAEQLWRIRALPGAGASFLNMLDGLTTVIGKTLLVPAR